VVTAYRAYRRLERELEARAARFRGDDAEMQALPRRRPMSSRQARRGRAADQDALLPEDPNDRPQWILEVRAGTGARRRASPPSCCGLRPLCEIRGWRFSITDVSESGWRHQGGGGSGRGRAGVLAPQVRVRRAPVQRVPTTEASGRIHTSAATVAVMPEAEEVEVWSKRRTSGSTASARPVRAARASTHLLGRPHHPPADRDRGQLPGREVADPEPAKALRVLKARLKEIEEQARRPRAGRDEAQPDRLRRPLGEDPHLHFPQSRITDHRIGLSIHRLHEVLEGDLDLLLEPLTTTSRPSSSRPSCG